MAEFKCRYCGENFKAKIKYPMCPNGCISDHTESPVKGIFSTAIHVGGTIPAESKAAKKTEQPPPASPTPENKSLLDKAKDAVGLGEKDEDPPLDEKTVDSNKLF